MKTIKGKVYVEALLKQEQMLRNREHHDFDVQAILADLYYILADLHWWQFIQGFKIWKATGEIELFHAEHCDCGFEIDEDAIAHDVRKLH